jgi:chromosome segregation ATPase
MERRLVHKARRRTAVAALLAAGAIAVVSEAGAQRIICWKDATGRVVGCGDRVPPEYRDSATVELDRHGVTRKETASAEEAAKRRQRERELAEKRELERRKALERQRQDAALLASFSSAEEIDRKRDRELAQVESQLTQLRVSLRNATARHADLARRKAAAESEKKPSPALAEELERVAAEKERLERNIAEKEAEKDAIRERFAEDKRRYLELKGAAGASAPGTDAARK